LSGLKKNLPCSLADRREIVDINCVAISLNRQLELLGINKSSYYYQPRELSSETLELLRLVDKIYTDYPTFGTRSMCSYLYNEHRHIISRDRMRTLYNKLQIRAIYQEPKTTVSNPAHKKYPYLLRDVEIMGVNHVWSTDITYVPINNGFVYLSAIIDWYSRYVLSWALHIDMEAINCVELLVSTLEQYDKCAVFNTDQGSQYTSTIFTDCLLNNGIQISMDGRGRWADNIFIERLWRSVKYECIYLNDFKTVINCRQGLSKYFDFYNTKRPHQSLNGLTPATVYFRGN
jgi:Transposase and inactivated derivatives